MAINRIKLLDVARDAGVSSATVSRAIAQPNLVSLKTLARVKASAARLGYLPDGAARALASGRSLTVGAIVPTLDSAIFSRALQVVQTTLSSHNYQLLIASHNYSAAAEAESIRVLLSRGVDGILLVGAERPAETWRLLKESGVAIQLLWCGDSRFSSIVVDNAKAGRIAAQHLIDLGHRSLAVVVGPLQFNDRQRARLSGVRAAVADAKLELPPWRIIEQPLSLAGGRAACSALLELADPPTAIVGGIDILAIGCMEEAHSRGLVVPDAISVIGIDNIEMSAQVFPSLTTVHMPVDQIGELAAHGLLEQISSGRIDRIELPVELVVRRSTASA